MMLVLVGMWWQRCQWWSTVGGDSTERVAVLELSLLSCLRASCRLLAARACGLGSGVCWHFRDRCVVSSY